ncbi:MAG TPA: sulfur carrier protein ThiS [Campylobacteraceae bacterium]|nr:sulfur carrier protein ThiS [Campylobacteraceae bacterium]
MDIIVNGEKRTIDPDTTIKSLLDQLGIADKTMASAVNMEVVKKEAWENHTLKEGDKVEFLHFVGGG